jgi:hypothetical protein
MNCANHADASAVAYCRTCGKALCANCTRPVRGVIYCEDCLGAKMEGTAFGAAAPTQTPYQQFMDQGLGVKVAPGPVSGPNPTVAGILAGFFPFGVGAVYTGQYAKGLAHLVITTLLIVGLSTGDNHGVALVLMCSFGLAFFVVYQIIDAVRSARAIQMSQPAPDPFGLAATFGGGAKLETSKIPIGAIVLILVGGIFLLDTMGMSEYGLDRFWPLILVALGAWLFARNWGMMGRTGCSGCQCDRCRTRRIMGPAMLLTIGILFLLQNMHMGANFGRTWPILLLVIGAVKLLQGNASGEGHIPSALPGPYAATGSIPPVPPVAPVPPAPPTSEVNRG